MVAGVVLGLVSIIFLLLATAAAGGEVETLLSIKAVFQHSDSPRVFDSWVTQNSVCNFSGITCDSHGFVVEIDLSNQNLIGPLPVNDFCSFKSLEKLSLGFNNLHGSVSGEDFSGCSGLKYLDLGNNFFSGAFPDISSLTQLVTLYANFSRFSGPFPWNSLRNMPNLQVLSVGDNPFDRMPFPEVILNLKNLNWIDMSNCSLEGRIPEEIGNLDDLFHLELSRNYLSGDIPPGITKLIKLQSLEMYSNNFTGELPFGLRNLKNLQFFDASHNNLHGNLSEVGFLNQLISLQLFQNHFSGEVPAELGNFFHLVNLSLYTNNLTGSLPPKLGSWASFNFIDVSENFLTGPIPPDMCNNGTMERLLMLQNNFTGEIPATYASCTTLVRFRVSQNSLSGKVPGGIWGLPNAEIIDLADNHLEGVITSDIARAKSLAQLLLSNNRLSGALPQEISQASSLVSMDLGYNQFSGEIPDTIGDLKELTSLKLQGNSFSGLIPNSLGSCSSVNGISMAENELSGSIPSSLGLLPALNFLNLSKNQLSGRIPTSFSALKLNLLDLSDNNLSGPIPDSLTTEASFAGNIGLCSNNMKGFRRCFHDSGKFIHFQVLLFFLITVFVLFLALLVAIIYARKKAKHGAERSLREDSWDLKSFHKLTFTEDDILDSIKPGNVIGKGSSGDVYCVVLPNGQKLAVKHIRHSDSRKITSSTPILIKNPLKTRGFEAEVRTLSSIRHKNVVKLLCSITSENSSLLVYEYMPNGSLWDKLHFSKKLVLDWESRYEIALGAARGLEYLHHGCEEPLIHRDVKSSNILLDENMEPRIADFGLAKIIQTDSSIDSTHTIAGTHGYIAPEYGYTNKVNEKSDIYSFGVVLMELVTGKRPIEAEFGDNKDLVNWVCGRLKAKECVKSLMDIEIAEVYKESALKVLKVAIRCTRTVPSSRPSMRNVVQMLEGARPQCELVTIVVTKDVSEKNESLAEKEEP